MADKRISELNSITGANTASGDLFVIVDVDANETKKITRDELTNALELTDFDNIDINGGTIDGTTIGGSTPAAGSFTGLTVGDGHTIGNGTGDNFFIESSTNENVTIRSGSGREILLKTDASTANAVQIYSNNDVAFYEDNGTTPKLFWDASAESLGIGTASPARKLHVYDASSQYIQISGQSRDLLLGQDGTGCAIYSNGNAPMYFSTNGSEAMRIDSSGNLDMTAGGGDIIMASGAGIDFSATSNGSGTTSSELLDDYEEGTWTPALTTGSSAPTFTYNYRSGNYTKIGNKVIAWFYADITVTVAGTGQSGITTASFPFSPASDSLTNSAYTRAGFATRHPTGTNTFGLGFNNDNPASAANVYFQGLAGNGGNSTQGLQTGRYAGYLIYEAS